MSDKVYSVMWNKIGSSSTKCVENAAPALRELFDTCKGQDGMPRLAGPMGFNEPILTGTQAILNGSAEESAEAFYFDNKKGFGCCKTNKKPYDLIVKCVLILLQSHCDDLTDLLVGCDGSRMDWVDALALASEVHDCYPADFIWSQGCVGTAEAAKFIGIPAGWVDPTIKPA